MRYKTQLFTPLVPIVIIILMINMSVVSAQVVFSEDFTNPSPDWLYYADNQAGTAPAPNNMSIEDGRLGSFGTHSSNGWNYACHMTNSAFGPWSFDALISDPPGIISFQVSVFPEAPDENGLRPRSLTFQVVQGFSAGMTLSQSQLDGIGYTRLDEKPIAEADQPGLRQFIIERNDSDITVKVNGNVTLQGTLIEERIADYNAICIWTKTGSNSSIDNIVVGSEEPLVIPPSLLWSFGVIAVIGTSYFGYQYLKKNKLNKLAKQKAINRRILQSTGQEFNLSNNSLISLVSGLYKVDEQYTDKNFKNLIPQELLTHRYLMQPTRLTIMKLLANQENMKSIEIRYLLDISWGEFSNHIKSLEEKGYVHLVDEFNEEGHVVQVVYITNEGRKEFMDLFSLLQKFVSHLTPLGEILGEKHSDLDDLYPQT